MLLRRTSWWVKGFGLETASEVRINKTCGNGLELCLGSFGLDIWVGEGSSPRGGGLEQGGVCSTKADRAQGAFG